MLREIRPITQIEGQPYRRWFQDSEVDLLIWTDQTGDIVGFQLCYNKVIDERALTWDKTDGFTYERVDDGESRPGKPKAIPILLPDGPFAQRQVIKTFSAKSQGLEDRIATFVHEKLLAY